MSYHKHLRYYGRYRSSRRSHNAWVKLCARKVRRLEEPQVIKQAQMELEPLPIDLPCHDGAILAARRNQRRHVRRQQQRIKRLRHSPENYMTQCFVDELIDVIRKDKWCFHYSQHDYVRQLLSYVVGGRQSLRELKQSPLGRLLSRPAVKAWMSQCGSGELTQTELCGNGARPQVCYVLTLDQWGEAGTRDGGWQQTSRPGKNLVLQLNFSSQHDRAYEQLINPERFEPFQACGHPIASRPRRTMAWVRMDVAEDLSHALIEEIQTDWLRFARLSNTWRMRRDYSAGHRKMIKEHCNGTGVSEQAWQTYEAQLTVHKRLWAEAALSAAIKLLKEEMGICRIYYHSVASGHVLKGFDRYSAPPKSLYKRLPEQFCFTRTRTCPPILEKCVKALSRTIRRRNSPLEFYGLDLSPL